MRNLKRFIVILLVVCSVFILASCKSCSKDKDPKAVPAVSNPDSAFLQLGNYKVSKKEAYYQLLVAYGLEALLNEVDDATLPAVANEEDFQEYLDGVIYGDEEKSEELLNEYLEGLTLSGLSTNPSDENYYVNYHRLVYRRLQYAKSVYKSEIKEDTFSEDDKKNAFESNFRKNNDLIIIRFNSQKEANDYLKDQNINLNNVNNGWEVNGTKLEPSQVQAVFENIYKEVTGSNESGVKTYEYKALTEINATLAKVAYNLPVNGYTKVATTYGPHVYLIYKVSETGNLDKEGNVVTYESKADEIIDILVDGAVSSTYATKASLENHAKHNLKIYDLGLENVYRTSYNSVYESLGYKAEEYPAYKATEEESSTVLFSYELNGSKVEVTADDVYNTLSHKYGNYIASLYLKQYVVLKDNTVYNIETGAILDQETYDEYYEAEVTEYKEAFEKGDYASLGYPNSYGWENFIRDYLGLLSEEKILINLDSALYTESLEKYKEQFYLKATIEEVDGKVIPVDQAVQEKMEEIFNEYFTATAIGIKAYYDNDYNGEADEVEEGSSEQTLLNELIEAVVEEASQSEESIDVALAKIVLAYNTSSKLANNEWSMYRAQGVQLEIVKSGSFGASSSQDDEIKAKVKATYDRIIALEKEENGAYDISGKDLSKYSTLTNEDGVTKTFTAFDFITTSGDDSAIINHENTAQLYFVTKVSGPAYIDEKEGTYKPEYKDYAKYLEDQDDVTSAIKTCINNYYIPAINKLANETVVTNTLVEDVLELLNSITFANKDSLGAYLEACKIIEE